MVNINYWKVVENEFNFANEILTMAGVMVLSWNPFMAWMQGLKTIKLTS